MTLSIHAEKKRAKCIMRAVMTGDKMEGRSMCRLAILGIVEPIYPRRGSPLVLCRRSVGSTHIRVWIRGSGSLENTKFALEKWNSRIEKSLCEIQSKLQLVLIRGCLTFLMHTNCACINYYATTCCSAGADLVWRDVWSVDELDEKGTGARAVECKAERW